MTKSMQGFKRTSYSILLLDVMGPELKTHYFEYNILRQEGCNEYTDITGLDVQEAKIYIQCEK